jgi:hypothetical protein
MLHQLLLSHQEPSFAMLPAAVQTLRNAETVVQRTYMTGAYAEPWWLMASTYYNETIQSSAKVINASLYLDKPIRCVGNSTQQNLPIGLLTGMLR